MSSAGDLYACLGGTEIYNKSRLAQMLGIGMGPEGIICNDCAPCPDLDRGLGFLGGYNPAENPWYDPDEPDSADFAGLFVTSVTGLEPGAFVRPVVEKAGVGAVLGQGRSNAPQIVFTGLLLARTCCGMDFGYRWLRKALRGSCGPATACAGDDLVFLSCEPLFADEDCAPVDFEAQLRPYLRTFKGAALIDGPKISSIVPRGCPSCYECGLLEVTFTLSAADPCIYRDPVTIVQNATFDCSATGPCIEFSTDPDCSQGCPPDIPCATDPNCTDIAPPTMPTLVDACVTDCTAAFACTVNATIPDGTFPLSAEGTLIIDIFAGDAALSGIEVQVWDNPLGLSPDKLEDCAVCATFAVSYVAPGATLTLDGGLRAATIACINGSTVRANPFVAGGNGSANFSYPTFICGSSYTVGVSARYPVSPLAAVTVQALTREC